MAIELTKIVICVTSVNAYHDRIVPIVEAAAENGIAVDVVCGHCDSVVLSPSSLVSIHAPCKTKRGLIYFLWAARKVSSITRREEARSVVLVEIATGLSICLSRAIFRTKSSAYQFVVTPARRMFLNRLWLQDKNSPALSFSQNARLWVGAMQNYLFLRFSVACGLRFIANSESLRDDLLPIVTSGRCTVIRNPDPVSVSLLNDSDCSGISDDGYFLVLSNVYPYKGIATLIKAYSVYRSQGGNRALVVAGSVPASESEWFRKCFELNGLDLEAVRVVGRVSRQEVGVLLQGAIALIHPSFIEGSPRAIVEALSVGLSVIASDIEPVVELQKLSGAMIETFPCGSAQLLAELMASKDREFNGDVNGGKAPGRQAVSIHEPSAFGKAVVNYVTSGV